MLRSVPPCVAKLVLFTLFLAWENVGEEFAGSEKAGLGCQGSAEPLGFCVRVLQQVFYTQEVLQNLPAEPTGSADFWGGGARAWLLRTGFFPPRMGAADSSRRPRGP